MKLSDKRVLVTGADGFIGSHLTECLLDMGVRVRALAQYNSFNYWGWLEDIPKNNNLEIVSGDVRDPNFCMEMTKEIDVIFHLAALIAIPYSYIAPDSYVQTNIIGTLNICQAALKNKCERVVHTSTSEVYGTARYVPIDEEHPLQPQSPYSASKIGADCMALSFFNSFDLPLVVARPFNTYGPRQSARAIIPTIISQIASGMTTIKLGDLRPTRDLNYVKDTCKGFLATAESENILGEVINIGSGKEISMGDLVKLISSLMGKKINIETDEARIRPAKSEVNRLLCDNSKLKSITGFEPSHTLEEGLLATIQWFSDTENIKKYKTGIYNV